MGMSRFISFLLCLGFLLGVYRGRVALWYGDEKTPSYILPIPAFVLPQEDREQLIRGIRFDSMQELKQLLDEAFGNAK